MSASQSLPPRRNSLAEDAFSAVRGDTKSGPDLFKLRTTFQQFMRDNEPLFAAMAAVTDDCRDLLEHGGLNQAAVLSKQLATAAATIVSGNPTPTSVQLRPFRIAAAELVASSWKSDNLSALNVTSLAQEIASATTLIDELTDRSLYQDVAISDETSMTMTAMAVAMRLMEPVMVYDFRHDRGEMVAALSAAVIDAASAAGPQIVPETAKANERLTVYQTLTSCLSNVMASVYKRHSKQFLSHVMTLPEESRDTFIAGYNPLTSILRSFQENAAVYTGSAVAFAKSSNQVVNIQKEAPVPR